MSGCYDQTEDGSLRDLLRDFQEQYGHDYCQRPLDFEKCLCAPTKDFASLFSTANLCKRKNKILKVRKLFNSSCNQLLLLAKIREVSLQNSWLRRQMIAEFFLLLFACCSERIVLETDSYQSKKGVNKR